MATLTESDLKQFLEQINQNLVGFRQEVKQDMAEFRQEVKQDMAEFRQEVKQEIAEFRQEVKQEIAEFRQEVNQKFEKQDERLRHIEIEIATVKGEITGLGKRVDDLNNRLNIMTVGFLSIVGVLVMGILGIIGKMTFFPNS
jgi:predicted nuclease with TOPRIM domain